MKNFRCTVCGYIHEGENAPSICPICKVGADKFVDVPAASLRQDPEVPPR